MRLLCNTLLLACAGIAFTGLPGSAAAQTLTIANFGGVNAQAQQAAFYTPFEASRGAAGAKVRGVAYTGDLSALAAPTKQGAPASWDVVEVESSDLKTGCQAGYFERLERKNIPHASMLLPGTVQACGLGAFVWSTVLAFDSQLLTVAPRTWADFWDVKRFPGKRGMRKGLRYNLEIALMADGVHRRDVYSQLASDAGITRALKKLDQLRPHIVWWESGAQAPQYILDGTVSMSTAFNGRIGAAQAGGAERLHVVWTDAIYDMDYWAIVKGSPRKLLAEEFVKFATSEEAQLAFSREIPYGPTHMGAILRYDEKRQRSVTSPPNAKHAQANLIDLSMAPSDLPSAPVNLRRALAFDANFWLARGAQVEQLSTTKKP